MKLKEYFARNLTGQSTPVTLAPVFVLFCEGHLSHVQP